MAFTHFVSKFNISDTVTPREGALKGIKYIVTGIEVSGASVVYHVETPLPHVDELEMLGFDFAEDELEAYVEEPFEYSGYSPYEPAYLEASSKAYYPDRSTLLSDLKFCQDRSPWRCVVDLEEDELQEIASGNAWSPVVSTEGQVRLFLTWYRMHCQQFEYGPGQEPAVTIKCNVLPEGCPSLPENWRVEL